jgi:putative transposase
MKHCGVSRHAWNLGLWSTKNILEHNKTNLSHKIKLTSAIDLHKLLVALVKPNCPWYYQCYESPPQESLRALRTAWDRCFKKNRGAPRFKKKGHRDSFTLEGAVKVQGKNKIQVPLMGIIKTYERLPQVLTKSATISRTAHRWFISFRVDVERQISVSDSIVGVDLAIKALATLSTGEVVLGANSYKKSEAKLSRMQRLNRHKVKGCNNWKKSQIQIARLHKKIANIRKDTLHKLTTLLAKNRGTVVIEDLNVSGMLANHKLAKSIASLSFFQWRRQLTYKCEL